MTSRPNIDVEYSGHIAIITLDKPKKLNALSNDDYYRLAKLLREIAQRDEVCLTLLIGNGRFFSA